MMQKDSLILQINKKILCFDKAFDHKSFFAYWPVCFGLGIGIYFCLNFEPRIEISLLLMGLSIVFFLHTRKKREDRVVVYLMGHAVLAILMGFTRAHLETISCHQKALSMVLKNQVITGVIQDVEQQKNYKKRYTIHISPVEGVTFVRLKGHLLNEKKLYPGCRVKCLSTLLPLSLPVSPFSYNFRRDYYFKRIGATGVLKDCEILSCDVYALSSFRLRLTEFFRHHMKKPNGDIAAALITGDRSGIPDDVRHAYTQSGLSHLLAISGLHMGLVAAFVFLLTRRLISLLHLGRTWISPSPPTHKIAAAITIICSFFYLLISGIGYPALRSFCMTTLIMIGLLCVRKSISLRSVAIASIFILGLYPHSLLSISFQLSFAAVVALIALYDSNYKTIFNESYLKWVEKMGRISWICPVVKYFLLILLTTTIATCATTPLSMAHFNQLTLQSVLGNILALPLVSFWIIPSAILSLVSKLFWNDHHLALSLFETGLTLLNHIAYSIAELKGSLIMVKSPKNWFFWVYPLCGALLCIGPTAIFRLLGGGGVLLSLFSYHHNDLPIGYVSNDRSAMLFYDQRYAWISSETKGQFHIQQWRQNLGLLAHEVRLIPSQEWKFGPYHIFLDPFRTPINLSLNSKGKKFLYLKKQDQDLLKATSIITNRFIKTLKVPAMIHGEALQQYGSAFLYADGTVQFLKNILPKRPWFVG